MTILAIWLYQISNDLSDRTPPTTKPFDDPDLLRSAMTYGGHPSSQLHWSFQVWGHELESWCTRHSVSNRCLSWLTWRRWRNHGAKQVGPDGTPVLNWKQRRHVCQTVMLLIPYPASRSGSSGLWKLVVSSAPRTATGSGFSFTSEVLQSSQRSNPGLEDTHLSCSFKAEAWPPTRAIMWKVNSSEYLLETNIT